jgi:uncharacterized membrane protein YebE (DUF533 family)
MIIYRTNCFSYKKKNKGSTRSQRAKMSNNSNPTLGQYTNTNTTVKEVVENTVPESKGEEKAKEGLMSWIKKNPGKTALIGTGIAALGGSAYLGYKHHKKKQAEALAEEAAQTAYSDTYDYYMRLFSDEE